MIVNCLKPIVGLSETTKDCFDKGKPDDYYSSLSGFFFDDPVYNSSLDLYLQAAGNSADMWKVLEKAKTNGIHNFISDFESYMETHNRRIYPAIRDNVVGEIKHNAMLKGNLDHVGHVYRGKGVKGSYMLVRAVGLHLDADETVNVDVDGQNVTVEAKADEITFKTLDNPIYIPLTNEGGQARKFYITYSPTATPYKSTMQCACNGSAWFRNYVSIEGFNGTDPKPAGGVEKIGSGLFIRCEMYCNSLEWICNIKESDYQGPGFFRVAARCLQLSIINAGLSIIENSTNIEPELLDMHRVGYRHQENKKNLAEWLTWLAQQNLSGLSHCYHCNKTSRLGSLR